MATTFASAYQNMKDVKAQAVVKAITQVSPIPRFIRHKNIGMALQHTRSEDDTLPTASYLGLNEDISDSDTSRGTTRIRQETVSRMIVAIDVDEALRNLPSQWEDEERKQARLAGIAAGFKFNDDFFLGTGLLSANFQAPIGIYRRLNDGITAGTIPAAQRIDCNGPLTLEKLEELIDAVPNDPDGNVVLFMNQYLQRKIRNLTRDPAYSGMLRIEEDKDNFGMPYDKYGHAKVAVIQRRDNYDTALSFTETTTGLPTLGSGTTGTASIWAVSFGNETGVYSFGQNDLGFTIRPFERLPGQLKYRSLSVWYFNYVVAGPRAVARLYNIERS